MKILKKIFLTVVLLVVMILFITGGVVVWVYTNPRAAWTMAEKYILPDTLKITWDHLAIDVSHLSGFNFSVDLQAAALTIKTTDQSLNIPVDQVDIKSSIYPFEKTQKIIFHRLNLLAEEPLQFRLGQSKTTSQANLYQQISKIEKAVFEVFHFLKLENVAVKVLNLDIQNHDATVTQIMLELNRDQASPHPAFHYKTQVKLSDNLNVTSSGAILLEQGGRDKVYLDLRIQIEGQGLNVSQNIKGGLDPSSEIISDGSFRYKKDKLAISAQPRLRLRMNVDGLDVHLDSNLMGIPLPYMQLDQFRLHLRVPFEKGQQWSDEPSQFTLEFPMKLFPTHGKQRAVLEKSCECKIPQILQARLSGPIWLSHFVLAPDNDTTQSMVDINFEIDPLSNSLLNLTTAGRLQINRLRGEYLFNPSLNLEARVPQLKTLARVLDHSKILVPSPFDVLEGPVTLKMVGPITTTAENYVFPLQVKTQLNSSRQLVNVSVSAEISLDKKFKSAEMNAHLFIKDLQLELPPLKPTQGAPRIITDKRILLKPKILPKKNAFKLSLNFQVTTERPHSIRLLSPYFEPYLPVAINIARTGTVDAKNSGSIKINTFNIVYLRRRVTVEQMIINLAESKEQLLYVSGRLSVQQTQYKVFIDINGPSNKPNIVLSSEPYLPRSEIINVLIYDRTSDQLVSQDVKTAGQVDAAMADRAIGLFGIWAFAATPIKGFSYNPSTKVYTAMVELSDDVTASIGTTWESATQVELQKRVSRSWILAAAWTPAGDDETESTKLVLQWEKRLE